MMRYSTSSTCSPTGPALIPLLIVCTARPELFERREHWGGGKTNSTTISLTPLSAEDTSRLVATLLDQALLPAGVQSELLDRAGGNPLYAQEFVRMLQDRELLVRGEGGWTLAGDAHELPESIHGIIAARLDTLSAEQKAVIQDASVIGRTAWVGAVSALGDQLGVGGRRVAACDGTKATAERADARRSGARPSSASGMR